MQVLHVSTNGVKESVDPGGEIIPVPDENEQSQIDEASIFDKSFSQYTVFIHIHWRKIILQPNEKIKYFR